MKINRFKSFFLLPALFMGITLAGCSNSEDIERVFVGAALVPARLSRIAQMTYRTNAPLSPLPEKYTVSGTGTHGHGVNHSYAGRSYNEKKSEKSGEVSRRSGFGQAGIRSSGGS